LKKENVNLVDVIVTAIGMLVKMVPVVVMSATVAPLKRMFPLPFLLQLMLPLHEKTHKISLNAGFS
jgi:hypothetical protein